MPVKVWFSTIYVYPFEYFPINSFEANLANNDNAFEKGSV